MKRRHMRKESRGFTLLEVAVAIAILGIAFSTLFGQISTSLSAFPRIGRSNALVENARNKLAEIRLLGSIRPTDQARGVFQDGVQWRIETSTLTRQELQTRHILRVEVFVEGDGASMSFVTYRFQEAVPQETLALGDQLDALRLP